MRAMMARAFHASPLLSKKHFQWILKKGSLLNHAKPIRKYDHHDADDADDAEDEQEDILPFSTPLSSDAPAAAAAAAPLTSVPAKRRPSSADTLARLRSVVSTVISNHRRRGRSARLGSCVTGTIFGRRRGHVHLALQVDTRSAPALLVELAASTGALVREMSSGLVRIALECERHAGDAPERRPLLEEPTWRAYCNGRKCGYALRRECGPDDWKVLSAVEPVSVGAGVLPTDADAGEGDLMYMRAKFERVVGSKDSEAFYMINPDHANAGPELSIYLLRV